MMQVMLDCEEVSFDHGRRQGPGRVLAGGTNEVRNGDPTLW
jgi:hypothetical protein